MTLGTLASTTGAQHAKPLLACIPAVLHLVQQEPRQAVRSSATACVAALVAGLATAALPALPKLVPALLDAADRSVQALAAKDEEKTNKDMAEDSSEVSKAVGDKSCMPRWWWWEWMVLALTEIAAWPTKRPGCICNRHERSG